MKDPFVKLCGTLRGINDMLSNVCRYIKPLKVLTDVTLAQGERILDTYYKDWPKDLPVSGVVSPWSMLNFVKLYVVHGTGDKVCCFSYLFCLWNNLSDTLQAGNIPYSHPGILWWSRCNE